MNTQEHLKFLGLRVRDRVTRTTGIVTSICFDLYGCAQAIINPGLGKDGKVGETSWFDTNRLELLGNKPVMTPPQFDFPARITQKGPAEKPRLNKP